MSSETTSIPVQHNDLLSETEIRWREQRLEDRETELAKAIQQFEREKAAFGAVKPSSDVIHLNVGGTKLATLRSTLTYVQDSMFAARFSGRWDESIERDKDGDFFIDQPCELFLAMIDVFRSMRCETPQTGVTASPDLKFWGNNEFKFQAFKRMVEYYGVTPGIYPTEIVIHATDSTIANVTEYPDSSVSAKKCVMCSIESKGHSRRIQSFEVTLLDVGEYMQIGWLCRGRRSLNTMEQYNVYPNRSLSAHDRCVAFDCSVPGFWWGGKFASIADLSVQQRSVIRCENFGISWFIDGKSVDPYTALECKPPDADIYIYAPVFSGKGHWKVSKIELEM